MNKNRIVWAAGVLFAKYGIEQVSTKQIAAEAHISEKILNEEFENKQLLIEACLKSEMNRIENIVLKISPRVDSSLEWIILVASVLFEELSRFGETFYNDLNKYAPAQRYLRILKMKFKNTCLQCFNKCVNDGFFISDINSNEIAFSYAQDIGSPNPKFRTIMLQSFIEGICTKKGEMELNRIYSAFKIKKSS